MRRAFLDDDTLGRAVAGGTLALPPSVAHRFATVLRLADGDPVEVFDAAGRVARGAFLPPGSLAVATVGVDDERLPPLWVFQALSRADKVELVAQKATELGAAHLAFFVAERGIIKLDDDDRSRKRAERLQRVANDAARQCGRSRPPVVHGPLPRAALLQQVKTCVADGVVVVFGAVEGDALLSTHLRAHPPTRGFAVVVGPEGGLSPAEQQALVDAGATGVRFSRFVLRTETAAVAALAVAQAALGEA
ncbi:MAG: 16S rRNA (uracil(1498)-N(3))-methyltransferase [Deltaproteobacteria bacterium]|nr:16S rRNA (uracil(1498)-N(3))-methyltransferase [Deltaproteobacteria bacterium]